MKRLTWGLIGAIGVLLVTLAAAMGYIADAVAAVQFLFSPSFQDWANGHGYLLFWFCAALALALAVAGTYIRRLANESGQLLSQLSSEVDRLQEEARSNEVRLKETQATEVASLQAQVRGLHEQLAGPDARDIKTHDRLITELRPAFVTTTLPEWMPESSRIDSLDPLEAFNRDWRSDPTLKYVDESVQETLHSLMVAIGSFLEAAGNYLDMKPDSEKLVGVPPTSQYFPFSMRDAWIRELRSKRDDVVKSFNAHIEAARSHGL
ncbi:hypothetical protein [Micromonospora sp. NPDC000668]|uniref:hypothetical protein n=1 Tax=Micromonospora sp. NPDC000668 TaxID=3364219 RepID=UPI0036BF9C4D